MLKRALREASLHSKLITETSNVKTLSNAKPWKMLMTLKNLTSTLQEERTERCRLLDAAFVRAGVKDLGIGTASYTSILDDDDFLDDAPYSDFPWEDDVVHARFGYVDLGKGEPDDVVRETVQYQRAQKLKKGVVSAFDLNTLGCHAEEWIRKSRKCKMFVLDTSKGLASEEEVQSFVQHVLATMLRQRQTRSPGDGGSDSDDNSDYIPYDEMDSNGYDWKYHLSGGTYGDDPDQDAIWDAYWDS